MPVLRIDGADELGRFARAMARHEGSACPLERGGCDEMRAAHAALERDPHTPITLEHVGAARTSAIPHMDPETRTLIPIVADDPDALHLVAAAVQRGMIEVNVQWTTRRANEAMFARVKRNGRFGR